MKENKKKRKAKNGRLKEGGKEKGKEMRET